MEKTVLVETSARHVHVTKETLETLFGAGYTLTKKKGLSQPGQFSCEERVQVIGFKGSFPAVSILGPSVRRIRWSFPPPTRARSVSPRLCASPAT